MAQGARQETSSWSILWPDLSSAGRVLVLRLYRHRRGAQRPRLCRLSRKSGCKVVVLERSAHGVGGGCHTAEATLPGFKHNLCSVVHTPIPLSPVYRDLELERHGVRYVYPDHLRGTIFPDHNSLVMHRDADKMAAELGAYSARDARTFRQLCRRLRRIHRLDVPSAHVLAAAAAVAAERPARAIRGRAAALVAGGPPVQL